MNIRKIKWLNHPVLGDLKLDFTNPQTQKAYNTILLAGENGTGKSTILESISSFLNYGSHEYIDSIEYEVNSDIYKTTINSQHTHSKNFFNIVEQNGDIHPVTYDRNYSPDKIGSDNKDLRNYGCVYSKARSDYKTQKITSTTISELDKNKHDIDTVEDFTSLKQLIIDIVNQDNSAYVEENKILGNSPKSWDVFLKNQNYLDFKMHLTIFLKKLNTDTLMTLKVKKQSYLKKITNLFQLIN
ncbi:MULTISPECIES: AAA family ATPase [Citrobacter]|uniref:AAA family ATPase n=1 Tax=Citrobacter TaxID=544 RepID=UPI0019279DD8|nr:MULTISPECIES: AAA family ATPase [Citrobacter]MDM3091575.1 AAA family ATPase [Citrobacter sp. Cf136]CAD5352310.1 protein of unknown function [Citrobacter freundii]